MIGKGAFFKIFLVGIFELNWGSGIELQEGSIWKDLSGLEKLQLVSDQIKHRWFHNLVRNGCAVCLILLKIVFVITSDNLKTNKVKYIKLYISRKGISQGIYLNSQIFG